MRHWAPQGPRTSQPRRVSSRVCQPQAVATGVKRSYRPHVQPAQPQLRPSPVSTFTLGQPSSSDSHDSPLFSQPQSVSQIHRQSSPSQEMDLPGFLRGVVASASVLPVLTPQSNKASTPAPPATTPQTVEQAMQQVSHRTDALLNQAVSAATTSEAARSAPVAAQALVQAVSSATSMAVAAAAGPLQAIAGRVTEDLSRVKQALTELQEKANASQALKAKLAALEAERDSLASQLSEAEQRVRFAEAVSSTLSVQLEERKAWQSLDNATQVFRRHVGGVPASFTKATFVEQPEDIIGKGGCATVYRWRLDGSDADWAVKSDPISYKHTYSTAFDPQRCGDLLPAFLPAHPNILAPRAWWVSPLAAPPQQAAAARAAGAPLAPSPGFKLYTLYERYTCSLWDHMQAMSTGAAASGAPRPEGQLLLDTRSLLTIIRDVAAALEHLAEHRVVHGDLKMENVLLVLETGKNGVQRVSKAVLIDFGLCSTLPAGVEQVPARGGTWMFKAPEQMTGPPGIALGGQERSEHPHVELSTDVWALGAMICTLCNNGVLPSRSGLPLSVPSDKLLKFGDRPHNGSMEPFYMLWEDVLPKVPSVLGAEGADAGVCAASASAVQLQRAHILALLRRLATGCMQLQPNQRLTAGQVREAAAAALDQLCD